MHDRPRTDGAGKTTESAPSPHAPVLLPGIQLLRGAAALLVILAHAAGIMGHARYFGASPLTIPDVGVFGVAVFFVISGFIIVIVSLDDSLRPRIARRDYASRRFIRILPFLWLCVIGYNLFTWIGTGAVEWGPALRAMAIWPVGELKPNVVWSLRHEILFYALFGLTMLGPRRRLTWLVAWLLAPLVLWLGLLPFDPRTTAWHPYNNEWLRVILLGSDTGANLQLGIGVAFGIVWLRHRAWLRAWLPGGLVVAILAVAASAAIVTAAALPPGLGRVLLWSALAAAIVYTGLVARSANGPLRRLGVALGNASFSIYLVHNPILLIQLEASKSVANALPPVAWMIGYVVVATAGGVLIHHLVEKPLIRYLSSGRRIVPWALPRRSAPR